MKSTFAITFYLKRSRQKQNGKMPIIGRIILNGEMAHFSTKSEINPDLWSVKAGKVLGKTNEAQEINSLLDNIKGTMTKIYRDMLERESTVSPEKVKNQFFGLNTKHQKLLELFREHNQSFASLVGISKSKATLQKYNVTLKHLQTYIKTQYKQDDFFFKDLNHQFISNFEIYLLTVAQCNANTSAKFMQFFKRIVLIARNNGWILFDPFANYKIQLKKVDRGYLSMEELNLLMAKEFSTKRLEHVRDIFVFSCFTDIALKNNSLLIRRV